MKHLKKFDQLNEGRVSHGLSQAQMDGTERFFEAHPALLAWMASFVNTGDAMRDYKKFIGEKNRLESKAQSDEAAKKQLTDMGFRAETVSAPSFGTKTFFKIDFPERVMFAELFQHLHDGGPNESKKV